MGAFEDYISGSFQGLARGVKELPENIANWARPAAEAGIQSYDGAITGTDLPYYGDDEISAAREYFDRKPRSNTSRLVDLIGNYMPGAAASKAAPVAVKAGETVLGAGPAFQRKVAETALDMAPEARMQRAQDMGFTTDVYHGTGKDFKAFNPDKGREASNTLGKGVYVAFDPEYASHFAPEVGGRIMPLKARVQAPFELTQENAIAALNDYPEYVRASREASGQPPIPDERLSAWMQAEQAKIMDGFAKGDRWGKMALDDFVTKHNDLIRTKHDAIVDGGQMVVFDPSNLRSANAKFDPKKSGSSDILAAHTNPLSALNDIYRNREER